MGWKFRKRIKILPGVTINISKRGMSTTIGKKGFSVNTSSRGTYLNTSIPGTGIYNRQKVSSASTDTSKSSPTNNAGTNSSFGCWSLILLVFGVISVCVAIESLVTGEGGPNFTMLLGGLLCIIPFLKFRFSKGNNSQSSTIRIVCGFLLVLGTLFTGAGIDNYLEEQNEQTISKVSIGFGVALLIVWLIVKIFTHRNNSDDVDNSSIIVQDTGHQNISPSAKSDTDGFNVRPIRNSASINGNDPYFEGAARFLVEAQNASTSMIQRKFSIGYNRAGRIMDQLEKAGIIGPANGSSQREVLCQDIQSLEVILKQLSSSDEVPAANNTMQSSEKE